MNKMDKCKLCGQMKELCNSHIIPEFFYKPIYDGLHRLHMISTSPDEKNKYVQKGIRERLLCFDCEQFFCKFEKYVSQVLADIDTRISPTTKEIIKDVDYHKFKMFQLSILWRMGVATGNLFSEVQLGPYEAKIKNMLLKDTPGEPYEFGCIMILLMDDSNKPLYEALLSPDCIRIEHRRVYRVIFGGCTWFYVISRHMEQFDDKNRFLNKKGELRLFIHQAGKTNLFQELGSKLAAQGKLK